MRIVYKVSGESLKGDSNISTQMLEKIKDDVVKLKKANHEVILVLGGGNFFRGRENLKMDEVVANNIGMLATVMNALAVSSFLNNHDISSKMYSAFEIDGIAHKFNYSDAIVDIKDNVLVIGGGLGVPMFSTDMVTVSKAVELCADIILMGKKIDGVYNMNPKDPHAIKYNVMTHDELFENQLKIGIDKLGVMDLEAMSLLCKHKIPVYVFSASDDLGIDKFLDGSGLGTTIRS